jgi:Chaperone of endosialidase
MTSFIGTKPNQVPTNGDLGRLAFLDYVGADDIGASVPTVASATNIFVSTQIAFVSGTTAIANITPPVTFVNGGQITLIPTGKFSMSAAGNIAIAISAEVGKPIYLTYVASGNKWYPSYSNTFNRVTITAPATGSTLTIADTKTLTVNKSITLTSADPNDNKTLTVNKSMILDANADNRTLTLNASLTFATSDTNASIVTFPAGNGTVPYTVAPTFTSSTSSPAVTATGTGTGGGLTATSSTASAAITATSSFTTPLAISATGNVTVNGDFSATGNVTAYSLSDKRLKENIIPIVNPIDKLLTLSGNTFTWNDDYYATQNQQLFKKLDVGVIAQEVQAVLPEAVHERENGMLSVDYTKLIPLLIECIKVQQVEINKLKGR